MHLRIPGLRLRSIGSKPVVSALLAALLATACGTPSPRRQLARHIDDAIATSRATVGVAILLPDGATFTRNDRPLPLLSVFKFPVALALLDHMERTGRRLSDSLTVGSEWLAADTYSPMRDSLPATGGAVSLGGLLRYTVSQSDNIACDLLLNLVGGPAAVDEYLGSKGFPEITIRADEREMHRDMANQRLNTACPSDTSAACSNASWRAGSSPGPTPHSCGSCCSPRPPEPTSSAPGSTRHSHWDTRPVRRTGRPTASA